MSNLTVPAFKQWKRVEVSVDDAVIQAAINTAEEAIDQHCGRKIAPAVAASARVFATPNDRCNVIDIHDCTTVTVVNDDGDVLDATDYQLEPLNGLTASGDVVPYSRIRLKGGGYWSHYYGNATVTITATWGWASPLPDRYLEAVKILTADILDQRDIRNGIVGFTEVAGIRVRENPMVSMLVAKFVRASSFGVA